MHETPIISKASPEDAEILRKIQHEAFMQDLQIYGDDDRCPANETLESILYSIGNYHYYKVLLKDKIIGGFTVKGEEAETYRLKRIFIDPDIHNKGIGTFIMKTLPGLFPDAKKWTLDTPYKNYRNHHFYEKFGYNKVSENKINEKLILFEYECTVSNRTQKNNIMGYVQHQD